MFDEDNADLNLSIRGVGASPGEEPGTLSLRIETTRGPIEGIFHPVEGGSGAVIFVGGAMGGLDGPADSIYARLPIALGERGVTALRLNYRIPNNFEECVLDVLGGILMFSARKRHALIVGPLLAVVALGVSAALLVSGGEPARQGGQVVQPGVQQNARVTDAGYTVTVLSAEFSGTESLIEMQIDGPAGALANDAVTIPASALAKGSIKPIDPVGVTVPLGKPGLVRMRPFQSVGAPVLRISALERRDIDGATQVIEGNWEIPLQLGGTAAELLWVDELRHGPSAIDNGVTVRPVRLLRSRTETLVTVQLTGPAGIGQLVLPSTRVGGERVFGARVTQDGDGLTTFSFPPTERGTAFQFEMGDLIVPAASGSDGYVDIALGDLIKERGLTGAFKEHALVEPRYLRSTSASQLEVRSVYFAKHSADVPRSSLLNLTVAGTYDDPRGFSLVLASGESLTLAGSGSSYSRGPTGDLRQGETLLHFYFESYEALLGDVRLTFGKPSQILRGAWNVSFVQ